MRHARALAWAGFAGSLLAPPALAQFDRGLFDAPRIVTGSQEKIELTLDLNGDGHEDAVGWWWQNNNKDWVDVHGYLNDGQGELVLSWEESAVSYGDYPLRSDSAVGNLDGNALDDFVFGIGKRIQAWRSNGAAPPTLWAEFELPIDEHAASLEVVDLTGDGLDDLLIGCDINDGPRRLRIYRNPGDGSAPVPMDWKGVGLDLTHMVSGEVTGDSTADAIVADGGVVLFAEIVQGQFGGETWFNLDLEGVLLPVVGDIDGDGDEDVVVYSMDEEHQVLRRNGPSSFVLEPAQAGGPATNLADIDLDGDLDGACCGGSGGPSEIYNETPSTFRIAHNDGTGLFDVAFSMRGLGADRLGGVVDLENDGDQDLVAGRVVYYADGPLVAAPAQPLGALVEERELYDLDRDGDVDYGLGFGAGSINRGEGTAELANVLTPAAPAGTSFVGPGFAIDVDGDGDRDLIVQHFDGDGTTLLSMRLLLNNGGGGFTDGGPAGPAGVDFNLPDAIPNSPRESVVGDYDNDGDLDFATVRAWSPSPLNLQHEYDSQFWVNNGSGSFVAGALFAGEYVREIVDLNNDTKADLVVQRPDHKLCFRRGNGDGTWEPPFPFWAQGAIWPTEDYQLVDFNGDGHLDIAYVTTNYVPIIRFNNGDSTWGQGTTPFQVEEYEIDIWGDEKARLFLEDLDGDGDIDFLASPVVAGYGSLMYALNDGEGGWSEPVVQMVEHNAESDLDGDGDFDLLGEHWTANRTHHGAAQGEREQLGYGTPGTDGMVPILGATGPFRAGEQPYVRVTGAMPGAPGLLAVNLVGNEVVGLLPGVTIYPDPFTPSLLLLPLTLGAGASNSAGSGEIEVPVAVSAGMLGNSFYHQFFSFDPGAAGFLAVTNGLRLHYGE